MSIAKIRKAARVKPKSDLGYAIGCKRTLYLGGIFARGNTIEAERYDTVSKATADNHICAAVCIEASIVLWEKSLIGSNQPADQWQPKLPAVCVTA